jgi:hypothetical protein
MLFDDAEVEQIHQHAQQYPIMEGQIGQGNQNDPDAEELDKGGETNNKIRQSDVRWCEDQLPKPLLDKLEEFESLMLCVGDNFEVVNAIDGYNLLDANTDGLIVDFKYTAV